MLEGDEPLQPVALLFILTMCMELLQAFANVMSVRWGWQGATTEGGYCTVQGKFAPSHLPILRSLDTHEAYFAVI